MDATQTSALPPKPGLLEATAILTLISGIVHLLAFLTALFGFFVAGFATFGLACFLLPLTAIPLVIGIIEVRTALDLLPHPIRAQEPPKTLAIVQVCLILFGNVIALVTGVLALVAYSDTAVQSYFAASREAAPRG